MIALYIRTSGARQELGLEGQLQALRAFIKQRPELSNEPTQVFSDAHISGKIRTRPELQKMLLHVEQGNVTHVITYSISRIARSVKHLMEIEEGLRTHGTKFISLTESIDTNTATGKLIFQVLAAIGEFESSVASERTKVALAAARKRGTRLGRKANELTKEQRSKIHYFYEHNYSLRSIAKHVGLSYGKVRRYLKGKNNE